MKKILILLITVMIPLFYSCEEADEIIENLGLTDTEVIAGLKEALTIGTDTAVNIVSKVDGYYKDEVIKILLPPEADIIIDNMNKPILSELGLPQLVENVIYKINKAAEDAAPGAVNIFWDAITDMNITDGYNILNGEDTAATHYLRENTFGELTQLFAPVMQSSLDKDIVAGVSAQETWNTLTQNYNTVANSPLGQLAGLTPVNTDLGEWVTQRALDGLFVKVADEEIAIRNDINHRVTELLRRVFG